MPNSEMEDPDSSLPAPGRRSGVGAHPPRGGPPLRGGRPERAPLSHQAAAGQARGRGGAGGSRRPARARQRERLHPLTPAAGLRNEESGPRAAFFMVHRRPSALPPLATRIGGAALLPGAHFLQRALGALAGVSFRIRLGLLLLLLAGVVARRLGGILVLVHGVARSFLGMLHPNRPRWCRTRSGCAMGQRRFVRATRALSRAARGS